MKDSKFLRGILVGMGSSVVMVAVIVSLMSFTGTIGTIPSKETGSVNYNQVFTKVDQLRALVDHYYLNDIKEEDIQNGIYKGVLYGLGDPYSTYYTAKEYESMQEASSGSYCGIGAYVSQDPKTKIITIVTPFTNGPAYEAGIRPGDIIYKVADEEVGESDISEVVSKMKGKEGSKVNVSVIRQNEPKPLDFTVTRKKVEVPTVESEMMKDQLGYIKVTEFDEVTEDQFCNAIDQLEKDGMKGLVIDLRNNPGGRLDVVVNMLDRMIKDGMIVYTKDKNGEGDEYVASDDKEFKKPVCVLINENSASASEVFAGAIQDHKIGTIVGTTSFGKGIVQSIIPLKDGSAIKLTVSKYYTPNGRNIHGTGIEPDVTVELDKTLVGQVEIELNEDNQIQKACEVLKGKIK